MTPIAGEIGEGEGIVEQRQRHSAVRDRDVLPEDPVEGPPVAPEQHPLVVGEAPEDRGEPGADVEVVLELDLAGADQKGQGVGDQEPAAPFQDEQSLQGVRGRDEDRAAVGEQGAGAEHLCGRVEVEPVEVAGPAPLEEPVGPDLDSRPAPQAGVVLRQLHQPGERREP